MKTGLMSRASTVAWLAAFCLLGVLAAHAVGPEVRDTAGLFSAGAIKQADEAVRNIQREFRKDLLVETFAGVPENRKADYNRNREVFFTDFVRERAQEARLDGIYVLIMKEQPPHRMHIQVGVGQATRSRAFLAADRDQLVKLLQTNFRDEKYDDGLRAGIAFVERTMRTHLGSRETSGSMNRQGLASTAAREAVPGRSSSPGLGAILLFGALIIGGIVVFSLIMRLMRGGMGGGGVPSGGGMMGGGGGGMFSSLLAGIGGAMAGSWLYDRFFGGHSSSGDSWASSAGDTTSDVGGDFASSGGDVDSGTSLGDTDSGGGGDFGGGDFGGGDFGGGGGDV